MKQRRSDRGLIRYNDRDAYTLTWIGQQYGIRLDMLQKLLGFQAQQPTRLPGLLGTSSTRRVLARWRQESLIEVRKLHGEQPHWVWLTRRGLSQMGLDFRQCSPKLGMLTHLHHVNALRTQMERQFAADMTWYSERQLRQQYGRRSRRHIPDGEAELAQGLFAVEVELTRKSQSRVETIIHKLLHQQYAGVWFFVNAQTRPVIEAAIRIKPERFALYDLATLEV